MTIKNIIIDEAQRERIARAQKQIDRLKAAPNLITNYRIIETAFKKSGDWQWAASRGICFGAYLDWGVMVEALDRDPPSTWNERAVTTVLRCNDRFNAEIGCKPTPVWDSYKPDENAWKALGFEGLYNRETNIDDDMDIAEQRRQASIGCFHRHENIIRSQGM